MCHIHFRMEKEKDVCHSVYGWYRTHPGVRLKFYARKLDALHPIQCGVKDAGLPKGATIGGLIRNGEGILVTGNTVIQPNDHVVVFCLGMMIKKIEKFFN
jgi:NhaP-type Na+/H+ and K+/H+ antiporter